MSEDQEKVKKEADVKVKEAKEAVENTELLAGYKTYIMMGLIIVFVALKGFGIDIPVEVWGVAGALGLGSLRKAQQKTETAAKSGLKAAEAISEKVDPIIGD